MNGEFLNMDCMEGMRDLPDKSIDLAIVDPPYFSGPEKRGYYGRNLGFDYIGFEIDTTYYEKARVRME